MWTNFKKAAAAMFRREGTGEFCAFFGLLLVRYFWFGVAYYPQLDDYAQYYNNTAFGQTAWGAIAQMGLLKSRPLAGVLDVTVWASFWGNMAVALAIISALYVASGLLFKAALKGHFAVSRLFLVLYLLVPFAYEGVYWISASSRIVVGLFFAALAGFFIEKLVRTGKNHYVIWWLVAQLLSFGLYEQMIVFSLAYSFLLFALNWKELRKKVLLFGLSAVNIVIYVLVTSLQKGFSMYSTRMSVVLPWQDGFSTAIKACWGFFDAWLAAVQITLRGFVRGVPHLASLWVVVVAVLVYWLWRNHKGMPGKGNVWLGLGVGALLFLAPMAPFFVLENPHVTLRNIVPSFCGMALMGDVLVSWIFKNPKVYRVVCTGVAALFFTVSLSETYDYRYNHLQDQKLAEALVPYVSQTEKIAILNLQPYWDVGQNKPYSDHVLSNAASDWALLGLMRNVCDTNKLAPVMPITAPDTWGGWNREARQLQNFDRVYYYQEGSLLELTYEKTGEFNYTLYQDGVPFGKIVDTMGDGKLELYE